MESKRIMVIYETEHYISWDYSLKAEVPCSLQTFLFFFFYVSVYLSKGFGKSIN